RHERCASHASRKASSSSQPTNRSAWRSHDTTHSCWEKRSVCRMPSSPHLSSLSQTLSQLEPQPVRRGRTTRLGRNRSTLSANRRVELGAALLRARLGGDLPDAIDPGGGLLI